MSSERMTAKDSVYVLISMAPDVCKTPIGKAMVPIPYPIVHNMSSAQQCSSNVYINGKAAFLHDNSYVDRVIGDEPGIGGSVITKVNMKVSHSQTHSSSVYINGKEMVRTGDMVNMNTQKP